MAAVDFGSGRFDDSRPQRSQAQDYRYQDDYDDYGYDDGRPAADPADGVAARLGRLTHYLGALVSVALMVGLMVWGYRLVSRDVSGIPVIRAIEGEARTAPSDPGGELASHTGLAVNDVAAGNELVPVQEVAIAPAATGLAEEDVAMGQLGASAQEPMTPLDPPLDLAEAPVIPLPDSEKPAVDDLAFSEEAAPELNMAEQLAEQVASEVSMPQPAIAVSARPMPRPHRVAAVEPASTTVTDAPAARPITVEDEMPAPAPSVAVAAGSSLVQIGAFDSNAIASGEWDRISGRFSSLFSGKSPVIQTTQRNGRTFYRLRVAGFETRDDARRFCAALVAEGMDCLPMQAN